MSVLCPAFDDQCLPAKLSFQNSGEIPIQTIFRGVLELLACYTFSPLGTRRNFLSPEKKTPRYVAGMRTIFSYEKRQIAERVKGLAEEDQYTHISKTKAFTMCGINAALIIGAATYLPHVGESIAQGTGLGQTFVGNIFIALSTSLPEVVVSVAALKLGAVDLAFGNILGSNLFNISILALDDVLYTRGPILAHVSGNHTVTAVAAMTMTAVAIIGLTFRASKKTLFIAWDALGIVILHVITTTILDMKV